LRFAISGWMLLLPVLGSAATLLPSALSTRSRIS